MAGDPQNSAYTGDEPVPKDGRLLETVRPLPTADSPVLFTGRRKHVRVSGLAGVGKVANCGITIGSANRSAKGPFATEYLSKGEDEAERGLWPTVRFICQRLKHLFARDLPVELLLERFSELGDIFEVHTGSCASELVDLIGERHLVDPGLEIYLWSCLSS